MIDVRQELLAFKDSLEAESEDRTPQHENIELWKNRIDHWHATLDHEVLPLVSELRSADIETARAASLFSVRVDQQIVVLQDLVLLTHRVAYLRERITRHLAAGLRSGGAK